MTLVTTHPPQPIAGVGGCVNKVLSKALAKDRKKRYKKAGDFADAIRKCLQIRKKRTPLVAAAVLLVLLLAGGLMFYRNHVDSEKQRAIQAGKVAIQSTLEQLTAKDIVDDGLENPSELAVAEVTLALMKDLYDKDEKLLLAVDDTVNRTEESCEELGVPLRKMISTSIDNIDKKLDKTAFERETISHRQLKPLRDKAFKVITNEMMPDHDVWSFMERGGIWVRSNWGNQKDGFVLNLETFRFKKIPGRDAFRMVSAGSKRGAVPESHFSASQLNCLGTQAAAVSTPTLRIESDPAGSPVSKDPYAAEKKDAEERFEQIMASFLQGDLDDAREGMEKNGRFLDTYLDDDEKKSRARRLADFFRYWHEAQAAASRSPETAESLGRALELCQDAEKALEGLPGAENARSRVSTISREALAAKKRFDEAEKTYAEIVSLTNNKDWKEARSVLARNKSGLKNNLDDEKFGHLEALEKFWDRMDRGEKFASESDKDSLGNARAEFVEAKKIAKGLPDTIVLSVGVQKRINEIDEKIAALKREEERLEAERRAALEREKEKREAEKRAALEREKKKKEAEKAKSTARFVKRSDGTVWDRDNNLIWYGKDNGRDITHDQAVKEVAAKGGGWRLPTIKELQTLYDRNAPKRDVACVGYVRMATDLIHVTCYWFWASDRDDSGSSDGAVSLNSGLRFFYHPSGSSSYRFVPVRRGN